MKKKLNKGFTLTEVMIATVITGLLIAAVMALFGPVKSIIGGIEEDVVTNHVTDVTSDYISTRLNKSAAYNIDLYTLADMQSAAPTYVGRYDALDASGVGETKGCMMLKYTDGTYQLYDFGIVSGGSALKTKVDEALTSDKHSVFDTLFYNEMDFRYTFRTSSAQWCAVGVTVLDKDGQVQVAERAEVFKLINNKSGAATSNAVLEKYDDAEYTTDKAVLIFYKLKDFTAGF